MITRELLSQYISLLKEREEVSASINRLEKQLSKMEGDGTVIDSVKGGYGGIQRFVIEGFPNDEYMYRRSLLRTRKEHLEHLERQILEKVNMVEEFIKGIDDSRVRLIVRMRYVEGRTWDVVSERMGYNSRTGAKMVFERFFEKYLLTCEHCEPINESENKRIALEE